MEPREESDDKNSEDGKESDKHQTSSRYGSLNPEKKSHNMNDLKTLDFNSADEIRQTMKAVLAGNPPQPPPDDAECCGMIKDNEVDMTTDKKSQGSPQTPNPYLMLHKTVQIEAKDNLMQCLKNDNSTFRGKRIRPGRPPKPGTSRKLKKRCSVSSMYIGKLSNVVPFKRRRYGSESESDELDSLVILY